MQMFSFANRGVYGDAVHAPFSWRFRMKNPPVLPVEDKKLLRHFNHKKVTLFSVGKRSGAVARQAGGLVFPLFSAEQSDGDYGKPDRRGDPERQQNDIRIVGKTVSDERDDSARDEISRRHADQCGENLSPRKRRSPFPIQTPVSGRGSATKQKTPAITARAARLSANRFSARSSLLYRRRAARRAQPGSGTPCIFCRQSEGGGGESTRGAWRTSSRGMRTESSPPG